MYMGVHVTGGGWWSLAVGVMGLALCVASW
jgi:hypothetical protein